MFDEVGLKEYLVENIGRGYNFANILIEQSITMIRKYLNYNDISDDEIIKNYPMAIILTSIDLNNCTNYKAKNGEIQSMTQGSRSITFNTSIQSYELSPQVKGMLPLPRMRLL